MKTPDKIYIHIGPHLGLMQANKVPVGAPGEEEYIRKDALLEFLNGLDTSSRYERFVIDNLITHIKSL